MLRAISESSNLRLRRLNISGNDLSRVEAELVAGAMVRLEEVFLLNTRITSQQTELVLARLLSSQSPALRGLYIGDNNLASVSAALLARAVGSLQTVSLDDTNLGSEQVTALLRGLAQCGESRLRNLDMMGLGDINLIPLPEDIWQQLRGKFKLIDGCRLEQI